MLGNIPKRGKGIVVSVEVTKVSSLFKVIFCQMIDSFLELHLRVRKMLEAFEVAYHRGEKKKKEIAEQNRFLKSG